jgi:ADP-ribose pyrophosphatase YjhB (NUDIX family)
MEPISIISDNDLFENPFKEPKFYRLRATAKGIVFDQEGKIALLTVKDHSLFPGGGVKKKETLEHALIRECMEEIGCKVVATLYLGDFVQYRFQTARKYVISFFVAHLIGEKGIPTTTDASELEAQVTWKTLEEVKEILESQIVTTPKEDYAFHFNARTHLQAFDYFLELRQ